QQPSPAFQGVQFSFKHFFEGHADFSGKSILLPSSPQTRLFKKEAGMASPPNHSNPIQVEGALITGANVICSEPYDTLDDLFQAAQILSTRSASLLLEKGFPKPFLTHWSNLLLRPLFTFLKFQLLYGKQQNTGFTRTLAMAQSTYVFQKYEKLRQWAQAL
ncbi:MAG: hypothetical protein K2X66_05235, partial [Cyanobacteria bacterium]|nr:hypothetical protein [Cyanobacteriota bacterium]